jgi:hypothetical protein
MPLPQVSPAWASTAVGALLSGRGQLATVLASTEVASYLSVPEPGSSTPVVALLANGAVRLPIGVCVATGELPEAGSTVAIGDGVIATRHHIWQPARWWDPRPHLRAGGLLGRESGLLALLEGEPGSSFGLPLAEAVRVAGTLAEGSIDEALGVIGLGPGLTPAGDDVVAGALAALALGGRLDDTVRAAIEAHASSRTTALSAALLGAAGKGQVIPQAATLLSVVSAGSPASQLRSAAVQLFGVGATSGHDLCAGIAGVLAALAELAPSDASTDLATTTGRRQ